MALHENKVLWVGTGGGHVAMIDTTAWMALTITDRHTASIRSLLSVRLTGILKIVLVLSLATTASIFSLFCVTSIQILCQVLFPPYQEYGNGREHLYEQALSLEA